MQRQFRIVRGLLAGGMLAVTVLSDWACSAGSGVTNAPPAADVTLTVVAPASGSIKSDDGSIDCGSTCMVTKPVGGSLTLTAATTDPGWRFVSWSQGCEGLTTPTCQINLKNSLTAAATFVPISCQDRILNGSETDFDCGGASCGGCAVGQACKVITDCAGNAKCAAQKCANPISCAELHTLSPNLPSGVYTIDPDGPGSDTPFSVYCDMITDGGGWTLVHKVTSGVDADVVALWTGTTPLNESGQGFLTLTKSSGHYLNRIATKYWNANGYTVSQARVGIYTAGAEVAYVQFNNLGADRSAWYSAANLAKSSWTDIATAGQNIFGIPGETSASRAWYINQAYNGCPGDTGWLTVDRAPDPCTWESVVPTKVAILYIPGTTYGNWTMSGAQADVFTVFVR